MSLFTGVGGLDFGFDAAGFRTAVAVELDRVACRTLRLNRKWPVLEGDIHAISSKEIMGAAGLRPGEADVLIGGPPCQPFSKSGYWATGDAARLDDPRSGTLSAYLRVLRDLRPRAFLLENVPGLAFSTKDEGLQHLLDGVAAVNRQAGTQYRVHWQILNAARLGVPQARERVFLVGSRDGAPFKFPKATHAADPGLTTLLPFKTAWDAIGDLPAASSDPALVVGGKWGGLLPSIPEGSNYLWHTSRGGGQELFGWRTRYWSFLLKLSKRLPSWTIQAQPGPAIGPFHWANRRLTFHELCRLQTFPDGLVVDCGRTETQRLLGNAVPSLLAEVMAREIRGQLLGTRARGPLKLLPPRRLNVPAPETVRPVPAIYSQYKGEHEAHPGTGKGKLAARLAEEREELATADSLDLPTALARITRTAQGPHIRRPAAVGGRDG